MIVTTALAKALTELQRNFDLLGSDLAQTRPELSATFRTASVKSFEYVYEVSIRLLRRALERMAAAPSEIDQMEFRPLVRAAAEAGLIDDPVAWMRYREKRNITSHTYDEAQAAQIIAVIPEIIGSAGYLLKRLEAHDAHLGS
jgi:nucleotidyltransferase substrate binding protein (TIGR01987 family)